MPYNISVGWNTREENLGMCVDGDPREGKAVRPVAMLNVDSDDPLVSEFTITRCDLQYMGDIPDDLDHMSG
jgi:hypothetical protein